MKYLQLNIFAGFVFDEIASFIKRENIDIITMQEVAGGRLVRGGEDNFLDTKKLGYDGVLQAARGLIGDPKSYFGNAVFYKPEIKFIDKKIIWMKPYEELSDPKDWLREDEPRCAVCVQLELNGKPTWVVSAHLAWGTGPEDRPYKVDQAKHLLTELQKLDKPLILSGDFNVTPETETSRMFNAIGRNLSVENKLTNTLDAKYHRAKHLFPDGYAVDYIFVDPSIKVKSFRVIEEVSLSDHKGLLIEF